MNRVRILASSEAAPVCLLLTPLAVLLALAAAAGVGLDIFAVTGELPVTIAICTPIAFVIALWLRHAAHRFVAPVARAGRAYVAALDPAAAPPADPHYITSTGSR